MDTSRPAPDLGNLVNVCDFCCDRWGILKEALKTGTCLCVLCLKDFCCIDGTTKYMNRVPLSWIPAEAFDDPGRKPKDRLGL